LALGAGLRQEWGYDEINLQGLSPKENREVPPLGSFEPSCDLGRFRT
jgi:hypothetical protein